MLALAPLLQKLDAHRIRLLVSSAPSRKNPTFLRILTDESKRAAAENPKRAQELAEVAQWLAEEMPA